jgi:hypothetical protein
MQNVMTKTVNSDVAEVSIHSGIVITSEHGRTGANLAAACKLCSNFKLCIDKVSDLLTDILSRKVQEVSEPCKLHEGNIVTGLLRL